MMAGRTWVWVFAWASCLTAVPLFRADFRDKAKDAGLKAVNVYGGVSQKDFILETTGNGVAIFDYDNDGREDIFIANGTRNIRGAPVEVTRPQLYHNDGHGHFTELGREGRFWSVRLAARCLRGRFR